MRRYLAAGIWLVMTVTATLIVWAAVSVVAADVTDRPAPVVAHRDVVVALQGGATAARTTTTAAPAALPATTRPMTRAPSTMVPGGRSGPTLSTAVGRVPTTATASAPPTTRAPGGPSAPPTTTPPPPATVAPTGGTATYSTAGGFVGVACTGPSTIRLVAALPNDGFQAMVFSGGPYFVQVNFVGQARNIAVSAACFFGQPFEFNKGGNGA